MKYGNLLGEEIEPYIFVPCNHFNNYNLLGLFASFFPLPLFYDIITEANNISSGAGSVSIRRQKFVWKLGGLGNLWSTLWGMILVAPRGSGALAEFMFTCKSRIPSPLGLCGNNDCGRKQCQAVCVCPGVDPGVQGAWEEEFRVFSAWSTPCCCQQHWHTARILSWQGRSFPLPTFPGSVGKSLCRRV